MKRRLLALLILCMIAGTMALAGCKESGDSNAASSLLLLQQQRVLYEIPKGVAQ